MSGVGPGNISHPRTGEWLEGRGWAITALLVTPCIRRLLVIPWLRLPPWHGEMAVVVAGVMVAVAVSVTATVATADLHCSGCG